MRPLSTPAGTGYEWHSGEGPDHFSLWRMRERFPRPSAPMGEAWFMSETRRMYESLLDGDTGQWQSDLDDALRDLASGPTSFGHMEEWSEWFPYLLPRVIPMIGPWEPSDRYSTLVSAVMVHCPSGDAEYYYPEFRHDLLATLGKTLLGPDLWQEGQLLSRKALQTIDCTVDGYEFSAGGSFSAALFMVCKYLQPESLSGWTASVASFDDIFWRAKWVIWLSRGHRLLLHSDAQPADLPEGWAQAGWTESWAIAGSAPEPHLDPAAPVTPFLGASRQRALQAAIRENLNLRTLRRWRETLEQAQEIHDADLSLALSQFDEESAFVASAYRLE